MMHLLASGILLAAAACSAPQPPPTQVTSTVAQNVSAVARFEVKGMACQTCASRLQAGIRKLDGVTRADVDFPSKMLTVQFDPSKIDAARIKTEIERLGFEAKPASSGDAGGSAS